MHMWCYYVVKKVGCRYSVYKGDLDLTTHCNSNICRMAQTAVLTSTSCDKLLVAVTQRMTELAA